MKKDVKKELLKRLGKEMRDMMFEDLGKGMEEKADGLRKVTVASDTQEGLKEGLSKAQKILEKRRRMIEDESEEMEDESEEMEDESEEMEDDEYGCGGMKKDKYADGGYEMPSRVRELFSKLKEKASKVTKENQDKKLEKKQEKK